MAHQIQRQLMQCEQNPKDPESPSHDVLLTGIPGGRAVVGSGGQRRGDHMCRYNGITPIPFAFLFCKFRSCSLPEIIQWHPKPGSTTFRKEESPRDKRN